MAYGQYEGKTLKDPEIRELFTRDAMLKSDWYQSRLDAKVQVDTALWDRHIAYIEAFLMKPNYQSELRRLKVIERLEKARSSREYVGSAEYLHNLIGMIGTDPELV
jgi:hypothetical protein